MTVCAIFLVAATMTSGVYSPECGLIAFEQAESNRVTVGIMKAADHTRVWTYPGPGNAAHPAWGMQGELYFTVGHDTLTAFAGKASHECGYNLHCYRRGKVVRLTSGRNRDWSPSPDALGGVWFVTDRGEEHGRIGELCRASLAYLKDGTISFPLQYAGSNSGPCQPTVSPDGKLLLFAEMTTFRGVWYIVAAPVEDPSKTVNLTPRNRYAYGPRFSPDGKLMAYTGFRKDDSGWMVFVQDLRSGREALVGRGSAPAFTPDGKELLLVRDGQFLTVAVPGEFTLPCEVVVPAANSAFQLPPTVGDYGKLAVAMTDDKGELWELDSRFQATSNLLEVAVGVYYGSDLLLFANGKLVAKTEPYGTFESVRKLATQGWPKAIPGPLTRAELFGDLKP